jgi:hypothetical protein
MTKVRKLMMALPIVAMSVPASAADLSGNWTVTLRTVRPNGGSGSSACFTLTQTSNVLNWQNSGTFTIAGSDVTGQYYAIAGVLTAFASLDGNGFVVLQGKLHDHSIMNTSFLELDNGQATTGNFTATSGCG